MIRATAIEQPRWWEERERSRKTGSRRGKNRRRQRKRTRRRTGRRLLEALGNPL